MDDPKRILHELVLNWKLRLVVSALFSMMGLSFLIALLSGIFADLNLLDQTIVGVAVFIVMIPVYLIIADLPKISEHTITEMLNEHVPEFQEKAGIVLKSEAELNENEAKLKAKIERLYQDKPLHKYLPNRPIKQAVILLVLCLSLAAVSHFMI
ncbi:MAG: hypothetical protein U5J95_12700 [Balneolaceae bacterium]|nr:hypothetical protein [Balneolaceae bacterium]